MKQGDFFENLKSLIEEWPFFDDVICDEKNEKANSCKCDENCDCNCNCECDSNDNYDPKEDELIEDISKYNSSSWSSVMDSIKTLSNEVKRLSDIVNKKQEDKQIEKKIETPKIERPSDKLSTTDKLSLHKLVGEYVDTRIRPYVSKNVDNNMINNMYAGLFEFGAWLVNKS